MLIGTHKVARVVEECVCRNSLDYRFTELADYRVHSTALMPEIPFEPAEQLQHEIDDSIFINDEDTQLDFESYIFCQNYLTTRYIGRAPLEYYITDGVIPIRRARMPYYPYLRRPQSNEFTLFGREFVMLCRNGDPNYPHRVFGTENAIRGYNKDANDNVLMSMGRYDEEIRRRNPINIRHTIR